uniref:Putative glycine rich protein n=1 Tax=Helianthus annuus TaxID=4232 RepID=A0A251RXR2_HELAN
MSPFNKTLLLYSIFLFIVVAFAIVLVTSEVAAAKELTSKHESEVKDAKHDHDDHGYDNDYGHGGYDNGYGGHDNDGHGGYDYGHGGYYNGGRHGGYCKYGCCGNGGYYSGGCRCCDTLAEATAYKQAHQAQTHN